MVWFASAPSNIALIKYMGKSDSEKNIPVNSSLSYTLNDLKSFVELELIENSHDTWEPLDMPGVSYFKLSDQGQQRYLQHLDFIKKQFNYTGHFCVRSCNNFPAGTGLASSASSFAALTLCAIRALSELTDKAEPDLDDVAQLSRQGSGSSARSFYSPWALWNGEGVKTLDLPYKKLIHLVVLITHEHKLIPSSEAHQRVTTSPLFEGRPQRAEAHLKTLLTDLEDEDWKAAYKIVWQEFMDMHELFHTSNPEFTYMTDDTQHTLTRIEQFWRDHNDGPLVTMDAGPNVHCLFREDQADLAKQLKSDFVNDFDIIM